MPTVHSTTCPLDCPDTCSLAVTVEDDRVVAIDAGDDHPITDGFICSKVRQFDRRMYHADRLLYPMRRVGPKGEGEFERVSWDDAITEITTMFRAAADEWGGESILPYNYGGSNGLLTDGFIDDLYFARWGASRLEKTICSAPTTAVGMGMYGKMPGVAYADYPAAKCIILWGVNPKATGIHLVPFLREAKRNGAFICTIDPRRNFSTGEVDLHLPIAPGTDLALALALIGVWHREGRLDDEFLAQHSHGSEPLLAQAAEWPVECAAQTTGLDESDILGLASRYAESDPAVIRCGWGLERNRNGGQAVAAVLAIPALMGKFGVRGGGYTLSNNGAIRFDRQDALCIESGSTRSINMTRLGKVLTEPLTPPIKALFVYNCNPVATVPDQNAVMRGLSRDDLFTVVFEQVHTDSTAFADIVLPATTFLEHEDIRVSYGTYVLAGQRRVVEPQGEARPNAEVFAELGRAMGWTDAPFHWEPSDYVNRVAEFATVEEKPADATLLERGRAQHCEYVGGTPIQFQSVMPRTVDRKIDLTPTVLGDLPYVFQSVSDEEFPLVLITPASARLVSSTFGEFNLDELVVTMNPEDASRRGISDGDRVRVFNDLGEVECSAAVQATVRPGVVSMPKGAWRKSSRNACTANALCPDHVNVVAGGACFNDARVDVVRAE